MMHICLENVKAINVVNDAVERGVELATDFVEAAQSDKHIQNILQVVENDAQNNSNLRLRVKKLSKTQTMMTVVRN
mgnify:FL=1